MTASESMRDSLAFCGDAKDDATHYVAVIAGVAEVLREQRARLAAIAGESSALPWVSRAFARSHTSEEPT